MASEKNLNLKKATVQTIIEKVKASETVILFTYQGLSVADVSSLRRKLRDESAEIKVYKNTLVKIALNELNLDLNEFLDGPNAILFSTKLLEAIKVLTAFAKEHPDLNIRAGIIKGDVVGLETIKEYASIPSMEGLLTMLAGGMIEHVRNLAIGLNLYAEKLNDGVSATNVETVAEEIKATPELVSDPEPDNPEVAVETAEAQASTESETASEN